VSDIGFLDSEAISAGEETENLQTAVKAYEKQQIRRVLSKHNWDKVESARSLGIALSSLYRKIDELGISTDEHKRSSWIVS
jgi:DNA-binding NtrC family response regulator